MTDKPHIRLVADTSATAATPATPETGNSGNSGNIPAALATPGSEPDNFAVDVARDVMIEVLETAENDAEEAARILALALADLRSSIVLVGRGRIVSEMLVAAVDETLGNLVAAAPSGEQAGTVERLEAAARAGIKPDSPLVFRASSEAGAALARSWFGACKPPATPDDTPPAAA